MWDGVAGLPGAVHLYTSRGFTVYKPSVSSLFTWTLNSTEHSECSELILVSPAALHDNHPPPPAAPIAPVLQPFYCSVFSTCSLTSRNGEMYWMYSMTRDNFATSMLTLTKTGRLCFRFIRLELESSTCILSAVKSTMQIHCHHFIIFFSCLHSNCS